MSKKYWIGFLGITIALILSLCLAYRITYNNAKEKHEEESKNTNRDDATYYYIMENNGYVIVYEEDKETVYEYTTIRVDELPTQMQEALQRGIKVDSIGQIYGFLENYSS